MSWDNRPYASSNDGYQQQGGLRSWFGGFPAPGKAVKGIVIANVVMFVLCFFTGGHGSPIMKALEMNTVSVLHGQVWRLFTFTYLHDQSSIFHILFNMLGLYMLGLNLERVWGAKRFFIFYTLGGFAAVLMYFAVTVTGILNPDGALVGASGGVLAVFGVCAVLFPSMQLILYFFPIPIRAAVVLFTILYGFNLLTRGANAGGDACHLAGMAFGVAWGYRGEGWVFRWRSWRSGLKLQAERTQVRAREVAKDEIDHILEKVHRFGISSLTPQEKRALEEDTRRRQRQSTGNF